MNPPPLLKSIVVTIGFSLMISTFPPASAQSLNLQLRYQQPTAEGSPRFHRLTRDEQWDPARTAVIVCDMWDSHHCVNAVRRVAQLAPRIDRFCDTLREQGVTIIHAPSSCMAAYENHPARVRVSAIATAASMPADIASWCDQIPSEEAAAYPIDQSEGGEDDDADDHRQWAERLAASGRNPRAPWQRQVDVIGIDDQRDFISDSGTEIWSILTSRGIDNVILVGVHTNMCVLGRPFGLRRLASAGKHVVLARDLTDTMYDYRAWPYASHFTGTDLIVAHIERYVCPTISSDQVLGDQAFRFAGDHRIGLLMLVAENEYQTNETLPAFAAKHLSTHFSVQFAWGSETERHEMVGIEQVADADALLVSVRRRALPQRDLDLIREFVRQGKPVIGIRTASHAFSLRDQPAPDGKSVWDSFDADVFGGNYNGHFGNSLKTRIRRPADAIHDPIATATGAMNIQPGGSLYKTAPLAKGARVLLEGSVEGETAQPVAWTFIRNDGGRSFYTSLGHVDDFGQAEFEAFLSAGIHWACGLAPHTLAEVKAQNKRYAAGGGKQRK
ncbi:isochorismatase family protein [Stieleria sp. ICT_E10.1]|uniref:ThuA domain-containing protein n=1 Tax=Stieleria sedimenti TaxID=2976331 RepID=UPI00217F4A6A|nr:ThuA domain-containing protein [Stieleria sedimenti]MCS7467699.1 isochorismatase family protein [Stieleria sedimenti]